MERRVWMQQIVGVLSASRAIAASQSSATQTTAPSLASAITVDHLTAATQLLGLTFTDDELRMMLPGINRKLATYEALRNVNIPLDTEPAVSFHPGLPDRVPSRAKPVFRMSKPGKLSRFRDVEELAFLPVTKLGPLLRSRKISSTELTRMYIRRLRQYGPQLNCVITLTEDLALQQASEADAAIRQGRYKGPLHGIPWGAKDLFATRGIKTTWGAEPFQDQVIDYDATVVTKLREAGAVLLAKLSMGALAQGGLWFGGMTKTPWNLAETSSGSSAGSASATAAGLVGFAIGTETLGSIVSPSIRCGTTGLRPTYGRVSRYGAMGLSWTMDKIGPICRSAEDCAIVLRAIHGPDGHDRTVTTDPVHWNARRSMKNLRIGIMQTAFDSLKGEEKTVFDAALGHLRRAGVPEMHPVDMSDDDGSRLRFLLTAEAATAFDDITRDGRVRTLKGQSRDDWPNSFRESRLVPAVEYIRAQRGRTLLQQKMEKFFADWDVIVTPPYALLTTTNLTGHPQVVVPCGFVNGMPRGLSFLGRLYDEGTPLRVAHAFQQVTEWHTRVPPAVAGSAT